MQFSVASIVNGAAVLITWVTIARCCCLSARRSWRAAAVWTELSRAYHGLDRGLDGIWDQRCLPAAAAALIARRAPDDLRGEVR